MYQQSAQWMAFSGTSLRRLLLGVLIVAGVFVAIPQSTLAQSRNSILDRLDALEAQLRMVQARSGRVSSGDSDAPISGAAQLEVSIAQLSEEIRSLRGRVEEIEHQNRQVATALKRFERDADARLASLEAAASAPVNNAAPVIGDESESAAAPVMDESAEGEVVAAEQSTATTADSSKFTSARAHYDEAFKQLNAGNYDSAALLLKNFVAQFPKDNLIGNAHYWLGETYYVRDDFANAADQFRRGYLAQPSGAKAPDNLLKLSMSLAAENRTREACVVLKQLLSKQADKSQTIKRKALQENAKWRCNAS